MEVELFGYSQAFLLQLQSNISRSKADNVPCSSNPPQTVFKLCKDFSVLYTYCSHSNEEIVFFYFSLSGDLIGTQANGAIDAAILLSKNPTAQVRRAKPMPLFPTPLLLLQPSPRDQSRLLLPTLQTFPKSPPNPKSAQVFSNHFSPPLTARALTRFP